MGHYQEPEQGYRRPMHVYHMKERAGQHYYLNQLKPDKLLRHINAAEYGLAN